MIVKTAAAAAHRNVLHEIVVSVESLRVFVLIRLVDAHDFEPVVLITGNP